MSEHIIPYMESCGQKTYFYTYRPHWKELRKSQAKFHDFHLPNPHIFTPQTFSIMGFFTNEQMFGKFSQKKKPSSNWVKAKNFIWCTFFFNFEIEKNIHQHQATNQPTIGWSYCSWVYLVEINQLLVSSTNQSVEKILWLVSSTIGWKTDPVKMGVFLSKLAVWIWWLMTKSASFT